MPADNGPYETERQARAAAHAVVAPAPGRVILDRGGNIRLLFLAIEDTGMVTGSHENKIASWLANYEDSTMAVIAGWIRRAYKAGKASALRGGTPLTISPDAVCGGTVPDPADSEFAYDCGNHSRFLVERSDGDKRFGENGGSTEACPEHLADAVAGMISGDENIRAVVSIRWNVPEGVTG